LFQGTRDCQGQSVGKSGFEIHPRSQKNLKKNSENLLTNSQTYGKMITEIRGCDLPQERKQKL